MKQDKNFESSVSIENNYGHVTNNFNVCNKNKTEVKYDPDLHISQEQAAYIKKMIAELVLMLSAKSSDTKAKLFRQVYNQLYSKFKVTSYLLIPKDKFDDAVMWLKKYKGGKGRASLKRYAPDQWRTATYKAIYSKARELNIDHDTVHIIASQALHRFDIISSLKDLTKKELEHVYDYLFSLKK